MHPRELVWEVWTNPEHIKEWFGPDGFNITNNSMKVKTGEQWNFIMHGFGQNFDNTIEYIDVIKPSKLSYKHFGHTEDYDFFVTINFDDLNDKTCLQCLQVLSRKK